jgi:outer membrane immunogenic protein
MKRLLLSSVGILTLAALANPAFAADLSRRYEPMPTKAPPYIAQVYNWTGFYIGVNGGGGWGQSNWDRTGDFDVSGGLVGGTVGYNWQTGPWVLGVEGDLDWSNINGNTFNGCAPGCKTTNDWLGTARVRVGYAFDRFLPYITGGLAVGNMQTKLGGIDAVDNTNVGWTAGAGVEFAVNNNWSLKAEYLYVDLGSFNCGVACGGVPNEVSFTSHIGRAGINYRF